METMKILWAVDALETHPKAINASISFLKALSIRNKIKVDAATVIFPIDYPVDSKEALMLKEKNKKLLSSSLGKAQKQDWFGKVVVLTERQIPQRVAVLNLTEYAKNFDYDAILVIKHSNKFRRPHYLGSFAEMTAFLSTIPVFLVNPDGFVPKQISKILMAMDEIKEKEKEFKELVNFFPVKDVNVRLFHRISVPAFYLFRESIKQYVSDQKKIILNSFQSIKRIGENAGAFIELDVLSSSKNIAESILKEARKGEADLIVTIHKRKGATGFLLGRITRRVLQRADRPVLLFRP